MPALTGAGMRANWEADDAWCPGCGLHHHVTGEHRPDCTKHPSPLHCATPNCTAVRAAGVTHPVWTIHTGRVDGQHQVRYFCPEHHP